MQNKQTPLPENSKPKKGKGETISELAHRHLRDEKHTTTDEELRNATVELSDNVPTQDESLYEIDNSSVIPSSTNKERSSEKEVESEGRDNDSVPNPYSVLSK